MYQFKKYGKKYNFKWLEDRLRFLDFRMVFCTRKPESFEEARIERLKVSGNPSQYDQLQIFVEEQELLRQLINTSTLKTFTIDISDDNVPKAVDTIADWLEETNGLYMMNQEID